MSEARPRRVLLCVSGGIAAYKAPEIVRGLVREDAEVQVVMTPAAHSFVAPMALAAVSKRAVRTTVLDEAEEGHISHIELADWPDLVVVAPATADVIARAAAGLANDLVTTCLLATRAPVLWAPAMNTNMWQHAATKANLATLAQRGAHFVGPDTGELACGWIGEGRMIDPTSIVEATRSLLDAASQGQAWAGRRVLVSAGPTREHIDPVRFVTNASTGAMGFAIAAAAQTLGAKVTLVAGPVQRTTPTGVRRVDVVTGEDMLQAMAAELDAGCDFVAMVAAVADLVPQRKARSKLPKDRLANHLQGLGWSEAVDVLTTLTRQHRDHCVFLGFAAEMVDGDGAKLDAALVEAGTAKLHAKGCQAVFVNQVGSPGVGFEASTNAGHLVIDGPDGPVAHASGAPTDKRDLARWILDHMTPLLDAPGN